MVSRQHRGSTPLHAASRQRDLEAVKILIESGADVDALDEWDRISIQITNNPQIIAQLVAAGSKGRWLEAASWT
ncbi:hypothetical protein RRF57_009220 [Xylaria bambusicola]|uniref:Uncharacterized protein n=1 Tax=Xylaria bambusicola TaxID=326684 RepID=A0AAN7UWH7_9PEZI